MDASTSNQATTSAQPPKKRVRALYDYTPDPNAPDTKKLIQIKVGIVLTVLREVSNGWTEGLDPNGKRGWFPSAYVSTLEEEEPPSPRPAIPSMSAPVISNVISTTTPLQNDHKEPTDLQRSMAKSASVNAVEQLATSMSEATAAAVAKAQSEEEAGASKDTEQTPMPVMFADVYDSTDGTAKALLPAIESCCQKMQSMIPSNKTVSQNSPESPENFRTERKTAAEVIEGVRGLVEGARRLLERWSEVDGLSDTAAASPAGLQQIMAGLLAGSKLLHMTLKSRDAYSQQSLATAYRYISKAVLAMERIAQTLAQKLQSPEDEEKRASSKLRTSSLTFKPASEENTQGTQNFSQGTSASPLPPTSPTSPRPTPKTRPVSGATHSEPASPRGSGLGTLSHRSTQPGAGDRAEKLQLITRLENQLGEVTRGVDAMVKANTSSRGDIAKEIVKNALEAVHTVRRIAEITDRPDAVGKSCRSLQVAVQQLADAEHTQVMIKGYATKVEAGNMLKAARTILGF